MTTVVVPVAKTGGAETASVRVAGLVEPDHVVVAVPESSYVQQNTTPCYPWRGIGPGFSRRALDIVVSLFVLLLAGLPMLLLAAAIRLESRGPAFFRQIRVGQGESRFTLLKLRSMRLNSGGLEITRAKDNRITHVGRFIRSTSLDELPQLINVLKGDMTLVGPRPETPALATAYPVQSRWIFAYRPGLTGPAQVRMRDSDVIGQGITDPVEGYLRFVVPARTRIEARYLAYPSIPATFGVLTDTAKHILGIPVSRRD